MTKYYGGVDLGSTTGKAVILDENGIVGQAIISSRPDPTETAKIVIAEACAQVAGLSGYEALDCVVGTGYGRNEVSFAKANLSEISCHAIGVHYLHPEVNTIVDIGGQDVKAISLNPDGSVLDFSMNDKCAAGTGRFLENIARILHVSLDELSERSLESTQEVAITSQCSVFAETEVISMINRRTPLADVAAGINTSICRRIFVLVRRVGMREGIAVTGGAAKNRGLVQALSRAIKTPLVTLNQDPQLMGAIGAAIAAMRGELRPAEDTFSGARGRPHHLRRRLQVTSTEVNNV
jgi:(R)-2-hydroxyacyl-CoA dehydratese activating ATPase